MDTQKSPMSLVFVSKILPGKKHELNTLLLIESIRKYGGKFSKSQIWLLFLDDRSAYSRSVWDRIEEFGVRMIPFQIKNVNSEVFFYKEVSALAKAEEMIVGQSEFMIWMDSNTVVLNEPVDCLLPRNKLLGYKPVHHLLVGSRHGDALDPFWQEIYNLCEVDKDRVFLMTPMIEDIQMRPYFNAGFLVISASVNLIQQWLIFFERAIHNPVIKEKISQEPRYGIFLHQAVLSGVILNLYEPGQLLELSSSYNYPLHLWNQDQTVRRPKTLENCISVRHEGLVNTKSWISGNPFSPMQTDWLIERLSFYQNRKPARPDVNNLPN
ncbi:hypothetical protein ACFLTX_00375 [Chloroflexota bacterium]